MPGRDISFTNSGVYHIFNKSVEGKKIFDNQRYAQIFLKIAWYYRSTNARIRFSSLKKIGLDTREEIEASVKQPSTFKVNILAYCLMPNHFHILIEQKNEQGVSKFTSDLLNSFTRYYNIANKRIGPIFLPRFKAVPVIHGDQLIHVSRYIHLNPYSSKIIKEKELLGLYKYSSYSHYVSGTANPLVENKRVMELFNFDKDRYKKFVLDHAQHQQMLEAIKHTYKW